MKGREVNLALRRGINSGNTCKGGWPWGEKGLLQQRVRLWLIWSHTMRDALASEGALCKQSRGMLAGTQVISAASIN